MHPIFSRINHDSKSLSCGPINILVHAISYVLSLLWGGKKLSVSRVYLGLFHSSVLISSGLGKRFLFCIIFCLYSSFLNFANLQEWRKDQTEKMRWPFIHSTNTEHWNVPCTVPDVASPHPQAFILMGKKRQQNKCITNIVCLVVISAIQKNKAQTMNTVEVEGMNYSFK